MKTLQTNPGAPSVASGSAGSKPKPVILRLPTSSHVFYYQSV